MNNLTAADVRDLLAGFAAAIQLDQIWVGSLPSERFHPEYDPGMWRRWRRSHLNYIDQLLPTVDALPVAVLEELTQVAITYEPAVVGERVRDLFADAAAGNFSEEELETATLFFGRLIKEVGCRPKGEPVGYARDLIRQWLSVDDPLCIAQDPECGYGHAAGFSK